MASNITAYNPPHISPIQATHDGSRSSSDTRQTHPTPEEQMEEQGRPLSEIAATLGLSQDQIRTDLSLPAESMEPATSTISIKI